MKSVSLALCVIHLAGKIADGTKIALCFLLFLIFCEVCF